MARRSDHSKEELKELSITAGYEVIVTEGLKALSARGVAAKIGYTVGTIYHIFGTHDNFILHINARTLDAWYEAFAAAISQSQGPLAIQDLAKFYIDYSAQHYNEWSALFEYTMAQDSDVPDWYIPKMRRFFDAVEALVLPYVGHDPDRARRSARVLWAGIHGICILSLSKKLDLVASESAYILAESFVDNYMRGLRQ